MSVTRVCMCACACVYMYVFVHVVDVSFVSTCAHTLISDSSSPQQLPPFFLHPYSLVHPKPLPSLHLSPITHSLISFIHFPPTFHFSSFLCSLIIHVLRPSFFILHVHISSCLCILFTINFTPPILLFLCKLPAFSPLYPLTFNFTLTPLSTLPAVPSL